MGVGLVVKGVLAFVLAVLVSVSLGVPASANGATVTHLNLSSLDSCYSYSYSGHTYTYCTTATGEETITATSSGNWSGQAQGTLLFTYAVDGTVVGSSSEAIHIHILYANDLTVLKEYGAHESLTFTSGGVTCTFSVDVHLANGSIQYDNTSSVCN